MGYKLYCTVVLQRTLQNRKRYYEHLKNHKNIFILKNTNYTALL